MGRQRSGSYARRALLAAVVVVAAVLAVTLGSGSTGSPVEGTSVALDRDSGELSFRLETFDDEVVASSDLAGRPVVLNGYASWCAVCERELPDFERVHQALGDEVAFVGFNPQSNDTDQAQAAMIQAAGVSYPTVRDTDDRLLRAFNPTGGLPVTVFVDASGVVRKVHRGLLTAQLLRAELSSLFDIGR